MSISSLFFSGSCNNQEPDVEGSVREAAVAGSFYPGRKDSLERLVSTCFRLYEKQPRSQNVAAVIVPHAGYVYSGSVAASAFAQIDPERKYDHIFLIGPSHHVYTGGASVNDHFDWYETPMGKVKVDTKLCRELMKQCSSIIYNAKAHDQEHCLEVQLPFLQYWLKHPAPIVPIIIATQSMSVIKQAAETLKPYFNDRNLFVISSDFSHYPSYEDAEKVDGNTGKAVESGSLKVFLKAIEENEKQRIPNLATSACGESAIAALMMLTEGGDYEYHHIQYRNSGDAATAPKDEVVGYHAFAIIRKTSEKSGFVLTDQEKKTLLKIARQTIANKLVDADEAPCDTSELTETLKLHCGAFVTLTENGQLRGCIGHFGSDEPLYKTVESMAEAAAFEDPRFRPLRISELDEIEVEISVLTPMKRIHDISEFTLGKQGIYMRKGFQAGTFLPQVADETHWTKEEFLGHCARDKAGIGWDGWKEAELYTYEALVFKEDGK